MRAVDTLGALCAAIGMLTMLGPPAVAAEIDHFILAVGDLEQGAADLKAATGIRTSYGGAHTSGHTANHLASLGPGLYLEVLGPAPGVPLTGEGMALAKLRRPEPGGFALRTEDAEAETARLRAAGLTVGEVSAGGRTTPSGARLSWKVFEVEAPEFCGLVPFFIEWGAGTPHPAATSPAGGALEGVRVVHPKAEALNRLYATLGVPVVAERGPAPLLEFAIKGPTGTAKYVAAPSCQP